MPAGKTRPNILFIMSDDHASNAISAYGSRLAKHAPTPNVDRIGSAGMRLENCHCVNSICTPSRANILTGQHSHINGVKTLSDVLPESAVTLPELLKKGGYQTALFGKWHLHCRPRGFDNWAILPGQGQYNDPSFIFSDRVRAPGSTRNGAGNPYEKIGDWTPQKGYVTDIITDMTLDWLRSRRDAGTPFYLCCHHKAPHDMFEYSHKHEEAFRGIRFDEPETLFEEGKTLREISRRYGSTVSERFEKRNMVKHLMDPKYPNGGAVDFSGLDFNGRARKAYQKYMQDYLRTVRSIDENVGRLLAGLDELGLADNTMVIYTSDQGMMLGEHDKMDKRWIFDESQRMPFLVRYPGGVRPGSVSHDMVDNLDFAPTLLDYAGQDIPESMQGRSFRSILQGQTPVGWRQSVYYRYWMHMAHHWVPAHYGIRTRTRKLVFFYGLPLDASGCDSEDCRKATDPGFEMYDLEKDPFEKRNVYGSPAYADDVKQLKEELLALKRTYGDDDEKYPELMRIRNELW
jgi:arylsulfatase A-like enzyme